MDGSDEDFVVRDFDSELIPFGDLEDWLGKDLRGGAAVDESGGEEGGDDEGELLEDDDDEEPELEDGPEMDFLGLRVFLAFVFPLPCAR